MLHLPEPGGADGTIKRGSAVNSKHATLASIVVVSALLCGCGSGPAIAGADPASAANPRLHGTGTPQPVPGSAASVARAIAARWAAAGAPAPTLSSPIEWRTINYTATVFNPGTPGGFTAFITTRRTILVTPASAATIDASNAAPARFATPADQALWQAAGSPTLGQAPAAGQTQTIPAGQYTFLPQGSTLTYRQAAALPGAPDQLAAVILDHMRAYDSHPPASMELRQFAYLIATAPLTDAARSAAWLAMAMLPGLHSCQAPSPRAQPRAIGLCADSADDQTLVSVDLDTGAILTIAARLLRISPSYPHVPAGTVIGSTTFPPPQPENPDIP
jgi:hypothetical protein